jgi:hypothetical protein
MWKFSSRAVPVSAQCLLVVLSFCGASSALGAQALELDH